MKPANLAPAVAPPTRRAQAWLLAALLLAPGLPAAAAATAAEATPTAVVGVRLADLQPEAWIARLERPDRVILDRAAIHAQNARMRAEDRSILDIAVLPDPLPRAWVRERIGKSEEIVTPPEHVRTVADLAEWLKGRGEEYAHAFAEPGIVRAAVDRRHVKPDAPIAGAAEVAFFPPMTGG